MPRSFFRKFWLRAQIAGHYVWQALQWLYERVRNSVFVGFILFLLHRYSTHQFRVIHVRSNIKTISSLSKRDWLDASYSGKLKVLTHWWQKGWFCLKNLVTLGACFHRLETSVDLTFMALCIELRNPFDKRLLKFFLQKKEGVVKALIPRVKRLNGRGWEWITLEWHLEAYVRRSFLQGRIIENMHQAVQRQKEPDVVKEAKLALKKGLSPLLITEGLSGSYWMRGLDVQVLGLFKPFDEEINAPNNPVGPIYQSALGGRRTRFGVRTGESAHREVAAYVVDQCFEFGLVPRTYYASFTHTVFFLAMERVDPFRRVKKTKYGSFQEFIEGFVPLIETTPKEREEIPLIEFQLLILLDVILGNSDRHAGNLLVGDEKLAAIDHGLIFSDVHEELSTWYWGQLDQGKEPLYPALVELLETFPYEKIAARLKKRCFIEENALHRMRERVALFRAAIRAGMVPADMEALMTREHLMALKGRWHTLDERAKEMVVEFNRP